MLDDFHITGMHGFTKYTWHFVWWIDSIQLINFDRRWIEISDAALQSHTRGHQMDVHTPTLFMKLRNETMMNDWTAYLCKHTYTLMHEKTSTNTHTHTNALQTQAALKPVQWVKSQNGSVCLISSQHKLKIHQETKAQSFLLLIWSIYSPSPSAVFYSILHNRQHINVMKCSQYNEVRGSTKRFIITSTLF